MSVLGTKLEFRYFVADSINKKGDVRLFTTYHVCLGVPAILAVLCQGSWYLRESSLLENEVFKFYRVDPDLRVGWRVKHWPTRPDPWTV